MMNLVNRLARFSFLLKLFSYSFEIEFLNASKLLKILAWFYPIKRAFINNKPLALLLAFICFPRFRLGLGRKDADEIPIIEHFLRMVIFRKVDLKLAPHVPLWCLLKTNLKYGLWQRHKIERETAEIIGSIYRVHMPLQRFDWTKPATMVNFISDPVDVEQVLSDRESFPTRVRYLIDVFVN